jgi:hypothetical protein
MKKVIILFLFTFLFAFILQAQHKHPGRSSTDKHAVTTAVTSQGISKIAANIEPNKKLSKVKRLNMFDKNRLSNNNPQEFLSLLNASKSKQIQKQGRIGFSPFPAYGFDLNMLIGQLGFPLNQIEPMELAYLPSGFIPPMFISAGTTLNWGAGIIGAISSPIWGITYRGSYFLDVILDPYAALGYTPADFAFDHNTNTLYCLYLNYGADKTSRKIQSTTETDRIPAQFGFFLASFKISITAFHVTVTEIPVSGSAIPLYLGGEDPSTWDKLLFGLACDRNGTLYTVDYKNKKLFAINKQNGALNEIGNIAIDFYADWDSYGNDEFVSLEYDFANNILYLLDSYYDGVDDSDYSDLFSVNTSNGALISAGDAPGAKPDLWTISGPGFALAKQLNGVDEDYDHFMTGFQIPVTGVFLAAPNPQSEFFADETSTVKAGELYYIKWFAYNVNNRVKLEYSSDGGSTWMLIADQVWSNELDGLIESFYDLQNPNSYAWSVPTGLPNTILIKISKSSDPLMWDSNTLNITNPYNYYFNKGKLVITYPNGGEQLQGNKYYNVQWRIINGIQSGPFSLEYTTDNGHTWTKINTAPIAGISKFSWLTPPVNSNTCKVRMVNYLTKTVYDVCDNNFTISTNINAVNFPNPFNPVTKISFTLEKNAPTTLRVFNSIGQEVKILVNRPLEAGYHEFEFNANSLPSGIYFYELQSGDRREFNKMMLIK